MAEELLPGGRVNEVVRVGATVRRRPPERAAYTRRLLGFFERCGWSGAPRFLGTDDRGREVLGFVEGHVPWRIPRAPDVDADESLVRVAKLVREFHDLTAGTALAAGSEVACHNDLSPKNTVYRGPDGGRRPVAFIDWDAAAPGERVHDVAHACWQYAGLGPDGAGVAEAARRARLLCDAYGAIDRRRLIGTVLWWQDRCWRGIEAGAAAGDPAMAGLRESGAARAVREAWRWVDRHRGELEARLSDRR
ncbi:hypothetical protein HDA32_001277 [Spinactinospora alkalitolerans]|uniref:Aminoglycoside phosphotransferase domain-containing protein n=1 Tax=Spinactinospora alkalitolerans TaxID=687207 RepID=A0A852TS99_9ACTN|nr:phosphotransferase [Spinactinospora alkalitolerans]NYE46157.1 hypothetical protein [Spinactinospora alkalitolerans]